MAQKTPQDRQTTDGSFTFTADGKTYRLPKVKEDAALKVPGEYTYAAIMDPDNEMYQLRLGLATLEANNPPAAALRALKSLNTKEMLEVIGRYLGESSGSSD